MNLVRNREDARWCPGRFHFALPRMYALWKSARTPPQIREGIVLAIERGQTSSEMYAVSLWMLLTAATFCAEVMARRVPLPIAITLALPLAAVLLQIPFFVIGGAMMPIWRAATGGRNQNHIALNSAIIMTMMAGASLYFVMESHGIARLAAWFFVVMTAANALASIGLLLMRNLVRRAEERCAS